MRAELFGQEDRVSFGEFIGVGGEAGAGDDFPSGILEAGQSEAHHLRPITGNVLQEFGVGRELAKEFPGPFYGAQPFFGRRLFLAWPTEAVLTNDAGEGVMAHLEIELTDQPFGAEASLLSEFDDLSFQTGGGLMSAAFGRAGLLGQGGRFAWDRAAQPFTDGVPRTAKLPDGSFDAMLTGKANDLLAKPVAICTHTIQLKIAPMHPGKIGTARDWPFGLRLRRPRVPLAPLGQRLAS